MAYATWLTVGERLALVAVGPTIIIGDDTVLVEFGGGRMAAVRVKA